MDSNHQYTVPIFIQEKANWIKEDEEASKLVKGIGIETLRNTNMETTNLIANNFLNSILFVQDICSFSM